MAESIKFILDEHGRNTDILVHTYTASLSDIQLHAAMASLNRLHGIIATGPDGAIERTPANLRVLRSLDSLLVAEMDNAGLTQVIQGFADQWSKQVEYVQRLWSAMSDSMKEPLPPLEFDKRQKTAFVAEQMSAMDQLRDNAVAAAINAKRTATLTMGGLNFNAISNAIQDQFAASKTQATTLADTLVTNFFRSVNAASFDTIERDGGPELLYRYSQSPDDAKIRPFCHRMIHETKDGGFTRDQIDRLDNDDALSNVWLNCGGYNCRHIWLMDTTALERAWANRKKPIAAAMPSGLTIQ